MDENTNAPAVDETAAPVEAAPEAPVEETVPETVPVEPEQA